MKFSDEAHNLRIQLDTEGCELTAMEIQKLERGLSCLRAPLQKFPVSDLNVGVEYYPRSNSYGVKLALALPGRTLRTSEVDERMYTAFERSVRQMLDSVLAYEDSLEGMEERTKLQKGTRHEVIPAQAPNAEELEEAVRSGDYESFRRALFVYEEPLRLSIGRWVQRYPEVNDRLGDKFGLPDILEEVFLNAFEQFDSRPKQVPLGEWLDNLIDPSLKQLLNSPDEELENISFVRSQRGTP